MTKVTPRNMETLASIETRMEIRKETAKALMKSVKAWKKWMKAEACLLAPQAEDSR